ncbi:DEAD/DEAH box helicase [Kitasatospora cinereorecta]
MDPVARLRSLLPERTPAAPAPVPRREPRLPETMDVFGIHADLIKEYEDFTKSATVIRDARIEGFVEHDLAAKSQWPDPWLSLNPFFADGGQVTDLVRDGVLHPRCAEIFQAGEKENPRRPDGRPLTFHLHQRQAIEAAQVDDSYVLTTGTGTGKSLAYIVPIVDRVLKERQAAGAGGGGRVRAIVVYPMNALANSQLGELEKYLRHGFGTGGRAGHLRPLHRSGVRRTASGACCRCLRRRCCTTTTIASPRMRTPRKSNSPWAHSLASPWTSIRMPPPCRCRATGCRNRTFLPGKWTRTASPSWSPASAVAWRRRAGIGSGSSAGVTSAEQATNGQ